MRMMEVKNLSGQKPPSDLPQREASPPFDSGWITNPAGERVTCFSRFRGVAAEFIRRLPGGQRDAAGFVPVALLVCGLLLAACAPRPAASGEVTIRVADGSDALAGLSRVVVTVHEAALHTAGRPRDEGWVELELVNRVFELGADGAAGALVAHGAIPPGPYDRVRVEVAEVYGEREGQRVPIRNIVEPIYLARSLPGGPATIRLEFIVLPLLRPDSPEPFAIYTKSVRVE